MSIDLASQRIILFAVRRLHNCLLCSCVRHVVRFAHKKMVGKHFIRCWRTQRRFVLGGLKNLGQQLSGESTAEDLSLESDNKAFLAACSVRAQRINALEPALELLTDGELRAQTKAFQARLAAGETLDDILEEAFAVRPCKATKHHCPHRI